MDPELKLAFEALTKDASVWDAAGDTLDASRSALAAIDVYRGAFSFAALDIADDYAELHARVTDLLAAGAAATRAGAEALRAVRNDFERYEELTQSELYALWQPVS